MSPRKVALIELLSERMPGIDPRVLRGLILRGDVIVDGKKLSKAAFPVSQEARVEVLPQRSFASRGGEKLAPVLDLWRIRADGCTVLDAGCSTGGFTDCLLRRGAARIYAVDVGRGQLAWNLRTDPRVVVMEGTNIMTARSEAFAPAPDFAVADLSFRSLTGAARHILSLTRNGFGVFLVKPQFEWLDPPADFHGVVRNAADLRSILLTLVDALRAEGSFPAACTPSALAGRRGNREFFFLLSLEETRDAEALRAEIETSVVE
jgi:23S rRNA (cytidine1920-2'-O)/16S rRNA (cytidine1409-2'-O)-methyltransferase